MFKSTFLKIILKYVISCITEQDFILHTNGIPFDRNKNEGELVSLM